MSLTFISRRKSRSREKVTNVPVCLGRVTPVRTVEQDWGRRSKSTWWFIASYLKKRTEQNPPALSRKTNAFIQHAAPGNDSSSVTIPRVVSEPGLSAHSQCRDGSHHWFWSHFTIMKSEASATKEAASECDWQRFSGNTDTLTHPSFSCPPFFYAFANHVVSSCTV